MTITNDDVIFEYVFFDCLYEMNARMEMVA